MMANLEEIKKFYEKIEIEKEVLSTMPKNNQKNINRYLEKIKELKEEYQNKKEEIEKNLNKRYKKIIDVKENNIISNLEIRLKIIEGVLDLINDQKTSYEKMGLDKIIYRIRKFYKDNLENINIQIEMAIRKFAEVGIDLTPLDFNYSIFVSKYMSVFFEERKNENSNVLKTKFEEVYWKCPDIITHIELNLRNIYLQKQSIIDRYYENEKQKILKQWNKTQREIINLYFDLKNQNTSAIKHDKKRLLDDFLNGKLDINDYTPEKIQNNYAKILMPAMLEKINTDEGEVKRYILEFLNSLYEYKNYMNFKFIVEDIKKYYQDREKYKKSYDDTKKKIMNLEKKLKKINKKTVGGLFSRNTQEIKQTLEQTNIIQELKQTYKELDLNRFYNKIYSYIKEDSTIYEVLSLANSDYYYLTICMIENNKTITQEKINDQIEKLDRFLKEPFNNIINNLSFTDEKDITLFIKDRYKLLSFNVKQEDFSDKNLNSLITILENIMTNFYLKDAKLEISNIEELLKIKSTL